MKKILALSGSNSSRSINQQLVQYVASTVEGAEVNVISLRDYDIPIYSIDHEKELGMPEKAVQLSALFQEHDGFIISTPEHNSSIPAVFKNMIDWISRIEMGFMGGKPVALFSTSPGPGGARNALAHTEKILSGYIKGNVIGTLFVPKYGDNTERVDDTTIVIKDAAIATDIQELTNALVIALEEPVA